MGLGCEPITSVKIHAMSRARAIRLRPNLSCGLVSISTPMGYYPDRPAQAGWRGRLDLRFHDIAHDDVDYGDGYTRFTARMASLVESTVSAWEREGIEDLVIHCDKGLSRSVAIAEAYRRAGHGELVLWECQTAEMANRLVLPLMLDQLGGEASTQKRSLAWDAA